MGQRQGGDGGDKEREVEEERETNRRRKKGRRDMIVVGLVGIREREVVRKIVGGLCRTGKGNGGGTEGDGSAETLHWRMRKLGEIDE